MSPSLAPVIEAASRREFLRHTAFASLGGVLVLSGCGNDNSSAEDTRTVRDYFGDVEIPRDPKRVVAADSSTLATMLALGVKPVAASVNLNSLPHHLNDQMSDVADITETDGFDLEKALSYNPDLIIMFTGQTGDNWNEDPYRKAQSAVATYGYPFDYTYIEQLNKQLVDIGGVLGRTARADELIKRWDERTAALKSRVAVARLSDKPVSVLRLMQGGSYWIAFGTSEAIALRALGISQPEGQRDPEEFGLEISLENLTLLNSADTVFVYVDDNATSEKDVVESSPLWQSLEPVKNGRVHFVSSGVWNSSDPTGLNLILDDIESNFIAPAEQGN